MMEGRSKRGRDRRKEGRNGQGKGGITGKQRGKGENLKEERKIKKKI